MWRDPMRGGGGGLAEWVVGWIFGLLFMTYVVQAFVEMIRPLLPWMFLLGLVVVPSAVVARRWWRGY